MAAALLSAEEALATQREQDAINLINQGKQEAALKLLESLPTPSANAHCNMGTLLLELDSTGATQAALEHYKAALGLEPKNFIALANIAMTTNAIDDYLAALAVNAEWAEGHASLGSLYDDINDSPHSIFHLERAATLSPSNVAAVFNLALVLAKSGGLADALAAAKRVVRLQPKFGPGNALLAELLWRGGGQPKETIYFAKRAIDSDDREARLSGCLVAAIAAEQGENSADAEEFLVQGASLSVGQVPCLARLGSLYLRLGRESDALAAWNRVECPAEDVLGRALIAALRGVFGGGFLPSTKDTGDSAPSLVCEQFLLHAKLGDASHLVNKAHLARALHSKQHDDDVMPRSLCCKTVKEAELAMSKLGSTAFLKDPALQRGQGIHLITSPSQLRDHSFARVQVLQRAVAPLLINGFKFGVRINALCVRFPACHEWSVFVLDEGLFTRCGLPYDAASTDPAVQVSSTSVQKHLAGFELSSVKGCASTRFHGFKPSFPRVCEKIALCVQAALDAGMRDSIPASKQACGLQMFGFDVIWDADCEPWICEANSSPQFQDAKKLPDLRQNFLLPMVNGLPAILVGGFDARTQHVGPGWQYVADV